MGTNPDDHSLGAGDPTEDEWFILNRELFVERPELEEEFFSLEGDPRHVVSKEGVDWLKEAAMGERACLTRLLFNGGRFAAFYALSSAQVEITSPKNCERLGMLGTGRVPASHMEWVVRSRLFKGVGERILLHASAVARDVAQMQGNLVLTLDPYDDGTASMWKTYGFMDSNTILGDGLRRMWLPLVGYRSLS